MPKKPPATLGIIYRMPLEDLHPHPLNPYGVRDDPAMQELVGSVKENGVLIPAIARPRKEGGYELISGHRRKYACEQLRRGLSRVFFAIRNKYHQVYDSSRS